MKTLADFYHHAVALMNKRRVFFGHGTDNAEDEAWWLMTAALGLPIDMPEAEFFARALSPAEKIMLEQLLHQRTSLRIPAAYLLKEAYQYGHKFYVDQNVLIPRSPIAELIHQHFAPWVHQNKVKRILDLCTGSGCLAILAAHAFPNAQVDASDLSPDALGVAAKNVRLHHLEQRLRLLESDVFAALPNEKYDIILSNPPYVDATDLASMPQEYHHEPRMALEAGDDGLSIVRQILAEAKAHLNPGGILVVEVGNSEEALSKAYPRLALQWIDFEFGGHGVFLLRRDDL